MSIPITDDFAFPSDMALFLDFDGTLAPFQDNPDEVHLTPNESDLILKINDTLSGALALISGRDLRDLSKRVPQRLWRLGNHGLYSAAPNEAPPELFTRFPDDLQAMLDTKLETLDGVWLEEKGPVIAIHHRANPKAGPEIAERVSAELMAYPLHIMQIGHNVVEIKPAGANKGAALKKQMDIPPFQSRIPVMIGDDTTDEDAFLAAKSLGGFGIKIGYGATAADYRLYTIEQLYGLLGQII